MPSEDTASGRRVAIFGATGVAGTGVLHACLEDRGVAQVRAITRRGLPRAEPRLLEVRCSDFLDEASLAGSLEEIDAVCFCLGISASQAPSRAEYRRITYEIALAAGRATRAASPEAIFHFISGSGTSPRSFMNWARVKAETEHALSGLGLGGCVHWRPAMILPEAEPESLAWGQRLGAALARPFASLPGLSISNVAVGEAMLQATAEDRRHGVIENAEMRRLAERHRTGRAR